MQTTVDTAFALTRIILLTLAMIMMFMIVTKQYQKPNGNKLLSKLEDPNNEFILEKIRFSTTKLPITTYEIGPTSLGMIKSIFTTQCDNFKHENRLLVLINVCHFRHPDFQ